MKVLLVSRCAWTLYNFRAGLMRALLDRGHQVMGGGAAGDGYEPKIEALGVPFQPLSVDKKGINPSADLGLFWALWRWYSGNAPTSSTTSPSSPSSMAAWPHGWLGCPAWSTQSITGLGYVFTDGAPWLRRLVEGMYGLALRSAHLTFFQNRDDERLFLERRVVEPSRCALMPGSGVDLTRFSPQPPGGSTRFLMVARLLREKGVYEFVEAARLVRQRHPEARFEILGGSDPRNPTAIPEEEACHFAPDVECLGHVEDVRPYLSRADVIVLPSYREGTPRSLLEAAAMGRPLIATDAVGCREAVEDGVTGLLVPIKNAAALAQAMLKRSRTPRCAAAWVRQDGRRWSGSSMSGW